MRVLIVLDHPYSGSFTHALVAAARRGLASAGHEIDMIDLHADGFDPVTHAADLAAWRHGQTADARAGDYQRRLVDADYLVLAFPIWWEVAPAMMKGFIDKTVGKGVAYDQPKPGGRMRPRLRKLQGVTMMTVMATPTVLYRVVFGNPVVKAMFRGTFRKIGVRHLAWRPYSNPAGKTQVQRERMLARTESAFAGLRGR